MLSYLNLTPSVKVVFIHQTIYHVVLGSKVYIKVVWKTICAKLKALKLQHVP